MATTQFVFLPGDVSLNLVDALQRGVDKLGRAHRKFVRLPSNIKPALAVPVRPLRYRYRLRESRKEKAARIRRELLDAGATIYGLLKSESRFLPKLLHDDEHLEAVIYGQHGPHSAMLAATNERIIYLDKKPMAEFFDEVSYDVISGIEMDIHTFFACITLHTPVKNYQFKLVNLHCAEKFARHIERHKLKRDKEAQGTIEAAQAPALLRKVQNINDMAGYYWLPTDEEERRKFLHEIPEES